MQVFVAFNICDPALVRRKLEQRYSGRYYVTMTILFLLLQRGKLPAS